EDASEYFAYCKRKKLKPSPKHFIQLFNSTDRDFFGSSFQTLQAQDILMEIYNNVLGHHFTKDLVCRLLLEKKKKQHIEIRAIIKCILWVLQRSYRLCITSAGRHITSIQ